MLPSGFVQASHLTADHLAAADRAAAVHRQRVAAAATAEGLTPASARPAVSAPLPVHLHESAAVAEGGQLKRRRVYGLTPQIGAGGAGSRGSGQAETTAAAVAAEANPEAASAAAAINEPAFASAAPAAAAELKEVAEVTNEPEAGSSMTVGSKRKAHAVDEQTARTDMDQSKATGEKADSTEGAAVEAGVDELMLPEVEAEIEAAADKEPSSADSNDGSDELDDADPLDVSMSGDAVVDDAADELAAEEENALAAEAEYEHSAANFECDVSGNVGFNIAATQIDRIIDELRQRRLSQIQRRDQQPRSAGPGHPADHESTDESVNADRKDEEKPLLIVKKKKTVEQQ